ncbi:unnamed protein product, partial [Sphenostylis stenocarpa]
MAKKPTMRLLDKGIKILGVKSEWNITYEAILGKGGRVRDPWYMLSLIPHGVIKKLRALTDKVFYWIK